MYVERNIMARWLNHCYSANAKFLIYFSSNIRQTNEITCTKHIRNIFLCKLYLTTHFIHNLNQKETELRLHVPVKGKGKAIPLQAWTGPEGSRRLGFPDFKTIGT